MVSEYSQFIEIPHDNVELFWWSLNSQFIEKSWRCFRTNWAVPCENVSSGMYGQRRHKSACASAQSDQDLHCPLTELFGYADRIYRCIKILSNCAATQADLDLYMFPYVPKTLITKSNYNVKFKNENFQVENSGIFFYIYFCSKHRLWYSLEPPHRGGSNEYHNLCLEQK